MTNPTSAVNPSAERLSAFARLTDDTPIVMLNLLKFNGPLGARQYAKYASVAMREVTARGGRIIYSGQRAMTLPSVVDDGWDAVALVFYPSRSAYLDMQTSDAYRSAIPDRTAGLERRLLYAFKRGLTLAGAHAPDIADVPVASSDEVFVVNLLSFKGDTGHASYLKYLEVTARLTSDLGREVVLFLEAEHALVSDGEWDNLVLVRYPSLDALKSVVNSDDWQKAHKHHLLLGLANNIILATQRTPNDTGRAT